MGTILLMGAGLQTTVTGPTYDPDAQAFFNAETAAGVTLTTTQQNAINQWVVDAKAAGIWTKFKAVYPMVGGTATAHKFNLINPADTNAAFRLTFTGGWTHSATGATPNGTNGWADTYINPNTALEKTLCYYSRTSTVGSAFEMGTYDNGLQYCSLRAAVNFISGSSTNTIVSFTTTSNAQGFWVGSRRSNSDREVYLNGGSQATVTTFSSIGYANATNLILGALAVSNGQKLAYSAKECAFAAISDFGLTDLESQLLYQITEKYQVALGRNINPTQSFYYNSAYNNETNAFLFSTQITDATIQTATNTLVSDLKTANIWTKMKAVYPMVGGTATTHKFNLVNAQDTDSAYRLSFVGGGTHSANGYQPGGVNGYANTFLTPSTHLSLNSAHLSFYSRTNSTGNFADMGVANNSSSFSAFQILSKWSDNKFYGQVNDYDFTDNTVADSLGFFCGSRTASNIQKTFKNGSIVTSKTVASTLLVGYSIPIGARYIQNIAGSPGYISYSNRQCAFASIGDGLSDAEALSFYNAVQTFQTTLGRQV